MGQRHNLSEQLQLFQYEEPEPQDLTETWAENNMWHSSERDRLPAKSADVADPTDPDTGDYSHGKWDAYTAHPLGFHAGSAWAALDRIGRDGARVMHPVRITGYDVGPPDRSAEAWENEDFWADDAANGMDFRSTEAVRGGQNVPYVNNYEDVGSISVRAPRENVHTWAEHVYRFPDKHTYAERKAAREGYDLVYAPGGVTPHKQPAGLTASPMRISPSGLYGQIDTDDDELMDFIGERHEDGDPIHDILGGQAKVINPAFVQPEKPKKEERKATPHPRLPGME